MSAQPPLPLNDPARLAALRKLDLMDSAAEEAFDRLTRLVRQFLDVPTSVVTLIDDRRQFFKAASGLTGRLAEERGSPLSHSFCQYVVTKGEAVIVDHAPGHPVVGDNPAICDFSVMAYLGVPVRSPDGFVIGTLCAFDVKSRQWTSHQVGVMTELAQVVMDEIKLRHENRERVRAEAELQRLAGFQQAVLDGTVHAVISTSPDGVIKLFSRGAEQMLGYSAREMVGQRTPACLHVESEIVARAAELTAMTGRPVAPGFEAFVAQARIGGEDEREWTYVRKDGSQLPVLLGVTALRDAGGEISGFLGIAQDLTERKRAEVALKASEERLGQVLGHAECLVWEARVNLTGGDWTWQMSVYPSGLYQRLVPEGPHQGAGLWYRFEIPEREEMNARSREAMLSGAPGYVQEFRVQKDGQTTWIRESVSIIRTEAQHFWLIGVAIDITRLRQVTTQLEQSEQRFRNAFDHAGIGMALVGLDGRWLQINRVLGRILGYAESELLVKTFQEITHPDDLNADLAHVQDLLQGRADYYHMEKRYFHRAGHVVYVSLTVSIVRDQTGGPVHFISQIQDITQSKQFMASLAAARDEALAASRLKSEFLANMSHEIRTPMNGVIGMADLLLDSPLTVDQRQMGRVIRSSAENLLTIINDILDFSKIEAGKLSIESQDFSLAEEIQQTVALLTPRARDRGLALEAELPPDLPPGLSGDAGRIQQVLVNLVGNAVKFTEAGGVTVIVQSRPATHAGRYAFRVEVRDTGIGITAEDRRRLFQPFTQADGSTTRKYGGTGLGLAISQQLVGLMDGRIGLESEVGKGSVFWFELELPVVAVAETGPGPTTGATSAAGDPAVRILVAEDNPANQLVIRLLLQKVGVAFDIVSDGNAVLERLAARDYAAVLMDCQMPQLDGYETTRRIRAQAGGVRQPRIPIIALTAHAMTSDRDKCLEAGMDGYLAKPIRMDALQEAFQRAGILTAPKLAGSVPAVAPGTPVLDAAQLAQLRELPGRDGATLLDDLIGMVLQDLPPEIARLHGAVDRRAGAEVAQLAHRLAGSAANIGAIGLRQSLQDLEYAGRNAEWPAADRGRVALDREWASVREALQSLQGAPS